MKPDNQLVGPNRSESWLRVIRQGGTNQGGERCHSEWFLKKRNALRRNS